MKLDRSESGQSMATTGANRGLDVTCGPVRALLLTGSL